MCHKFASEGSLRRTFCSWIYIVFKSRSYLSYICFYYGISAVHYMISKTMKHFEPIFKRVQYQSSPRLKWSWLYQTTFHLSSDFCLEKKVLFQNCKEKLFCSVFRNKCGHASVRAKHEATLQSFEVLGGQNVLYCIFYSEFYLKIDFRDDFH